MIITIHPGIQVLENHTFPHIEYMDGGCCFLQPNNVYTAFYMGQNIEHGFLFACVSGALTHAINVVTDVYQPFSLSIYEVT